jgi:pimeloyl-ACP methyl ester carboxylesterase
MQILGHLGLEYETQGEGENVLLIHGSHIADSFLPWSKEPALAGYHVIRYHRRGFAGSRAISAPYSIENQAHDALKLLNHLGVTRTHVIGHSYGGAIALQLAIDAADVVRSLVLLEPALMMVPSGPRFFEAMAPAMTLFASGDTERAVDAFNQLVAGPQWRNELEGAVPGGPEQAIRDGATFFDVEVPALQQWVFDETQAARISQPVLYMLGAASPVVFEEGRQLLRSWLPQTEDVVIPGTDHRLQMQTPGLTAQAVVGFFSRVESVRGLGRSQTLS